MSLMKGFSPFQWQVEFALMQELHWKCKNVKMPQFGDIKLQVTHSLVV